MDSELSFDQHVSSICSKDSKKLHALGRIDNFMSFEKRKTLMKAFIKSQFICCSSIIYCFIQEQQIKNQSHSWKNVKVSLLCHIFSFAELLENDRSLSIHNMNIKSRAIESWKFTILLQVS